MRRIIYDGDSFYELDEECVKRHRQEQGNGKNQVRGQMPDKNAPYRSDEKERKAMR